MTPNFNKYLYLYTNTLLCCKVALYVLKKSFRHSWSRNFYHFTRCKKTLNIPITWACVKDSPGFSTTDLILVNSSWQYSAQCPVPGESVRCHRDQCVPSPDNCGCSLLGPSAGLNQKKLIKSLKRDADLPGISRLGAAAGCRLLDNTTLYLSPG